MPDTIEDEVRTALRDRAGRGELADIEVTFSVTGGAPGDPPLDEALRLSGDGTAKAYSRTSALVMQESSAQLSEAEMRELLLLISEVVDELVPRSQARFLPDSVLGRITVTIDGQEASFYFLADEEQAEQQGQELSPEATLALRGLARLQRRILHVGDLEDQEP